MSLPSGTIEELDIGMIPFADQQHQEEFAQQLIRDKVVEKQPTGGYRQLFPRTITPDMALRFMHNYPRAPAAPRPLPVAPLPEKLEKRRSDSPQPPILSMPPLQSVPLRRQTSAGEKPTEKKKRTTKRKQHPTEEVNEQKKTLSEESIDEVMC